MTLPTISCLRTPFILLLWSETGMGFLSIHCSLFSPAALRMQNVTTIGNAWYNLSAPRHTPWDMDRMACRLHTPLQWLWGVASCVQSQPEDTRSHEVFHYRKSAQRNKLVHDNLYQSWPVSGGHHVCHSHRQGFKLVIFFQITQDSIVLLIDHSVGLAEYWSWATGWSNGNWAINLTVWFVQSNMVLTKDSCHDHIDDVFVA